MTKGEKLDVRKSGGGSFPVTFDNESTCRSCGATILWCETLRGRKMPLDVEPLDDGYESHWATCPNASEHRKGGTGSPTPPPRQPRGPSLEERVSALERAVFGEAPRIGGAEPNPAVKDLPF